MVFADVCIVFCQIFALSGSPNFQDRAKRTRGQEDLQGWTSGLTPFKSEDMQSQKCCNEDFAERPDLSELLAGSEGVSRFKGVLRPSRGFGMLSGLCGQAACQPCPSLGLIAQYMHLCVPICLHSSGYVLSSLPCQKPCSNPASQLSTK